MSEDFEARLANLEARVAALEPKPEVWAVSAPGVCIRGYPDSSACTEASLFRRRKGCDGEACKAKSSEYYRNRRVAQADEAG